MCVRPWLNWIEHLTTDQKVWGSNPYGRAIFHLIKSPFFSPPQSEGGFLFLKAVA